MRYIVFTRKSCPNCPPVKELLLKKLGKGDEIDCDTEEGLEMARSNLVSSTPTAIFYSDDGEEIGRAHTADEVRSIAGK